MNEISLKSRLLASYLISNKLKLRSGEEVLLKEEFFPLTQVEFEGKKYNAPKNYDYYLKKIYGDYMKLPPKEKRVNHGCLEVNFNTNK